MDYAHDNDLREKPLTVYWLVQPIHVVQQYPPVPPNTTGTIVAEF